MKQLCFGANEINTQMESKIKVLLLSHPNENLLEEVILLVPQVASEISLIAHSHSSEHEVLVLRSSLL